MDDSPTIMLIAGFAKTFAVQGQQKREGVSQGGPMIGDEQVDGSSIVCEAVPIRWAMIPYSAHHHPLRVSRPPFHRWKDDVFVYECFTKLLFAVFTSFFLPSSQASLYRLLKLLFAIFTSFSQST